MGILRFILAAAVICAHSTPILGLPIIGGGLAVKSFFLISGFYMTLILDGKYERKRHALWLFYSNRFLRIYPMYYAALLIGVILYAVASMATGRPVDRLQYWAQAAHSGLWFPLLLLVLAQVLIVGIELSSFFSFNARDGFLWGADHPGSVPAWTFCFLPQAWTIGIELVFYALVPFLVHLRTRVLWALVLINLLGIVVLTLLWNDPLLAVVLDHFFPFELGFFVLGILTYRLLYKKETPGFGSARFNWLVVAAIVVTSFAFGSAEGTPAYYLCELIYLVLIFLGVPFLFQFTRDLRADRFIGELSYPMYLSHIPVKWVILGLAGVSHRGTFSIPGILLLAATVLVSIAMVLCIDYPVDRWRQRRVGASLARALPAGGLGNGGN